MRIYNDCLDIAGLTTLFHELSAVMLHTGLQPPVCSLLGINHHKSHLSAAVDLVQHRPGADH
jgi:hypothetical protein